VEVINQFLIGVLGLRDAQLELPLFGLKHDGLVVHAADHIERGTGLAPQRQFEEVVLNAGLQGPLELGLDLKEPIGGTESPDTLMGAFMVVVLQPEFDAFPGLLKTFELSPGQELTPDQSPKAFDLSQGHGMMRAALDVGHSIFLQLRFEPTHPTPVGVLPTVVGEHLLGRLILPGGHPIDLDHRMRRRTPEQIGPGDVSGVIVQVGDEVGVLSSQAEGEDVALPHLIRGGSFEEPRSSHVPFAPLTARRLHQPGPAHSTPDRFRTGG